MINNRRLKDAATIAIEVPIEVTASERLSLAAAIKALDFGFLASLYCKSKHRT